MRTVTCGDVTDPVFFNDRQNSDLDPNATYTYNISNGYIVDLSGFTKTKNWAKGFVTTIGKGSGVATATVYGLQPNANFEYDIYQYSAQSSPSKYCL